MICCLCRLFSLDCLKKTTGIKSYNDDAVFFAAEKLAYDRELSPLVGETCYEELCAAKQSNSLTPVQSALIDKLEPFAAWALKYYFLETRSLEIEPSGNYDRQVNDASDALKTQLLAAQKYVEYYKAQVVAFLDANAADFPCYTPLPRACGDSAEPNGFYIPIRTW